MRGLGSRLPRLAHLLAVVPLVLAGCASGPGDAPSAGSTRAQLVWPEPPNPARFVFETPLSNVRSIRRERDEDRLKRLFAGEAAVERPAYVKPAALAAYRGKIYVADPGQGAVVVFDVPRGKVFAIGTRAPEPLVRPVALAIDAQGDVYVLDAVRRKVFVYDEYGLLRTTLGRPESLAKPVGLAVSADGRRIYVVDRGSMDADDHKVVVYAPDGAELGRIGRRGAGEGEFNVPLAAAVSPDGTLHVLDSGNFRVQAFDPDGRFRRAFGSLGNGLGQFSRARSLAVDAAGRIYVSDAFFNNVQIFEPSGQLLMWLGVAGRQNLPGQFGLIGGIAVDETGRLYVIDQLHPKIEVYRPVDARR